MGLHDRIVETSTYNPDDFMPFRVDGREIGHIARTFWPRLEPYSDTLSLKDDTVYLDPDLRSYEQRTVAMNAILREIYNDDSRGFGQWCNEPAPVIVNFMGAPIFEVERAATTVLGLINRSVHLNGLVGSDGANSVWVARRSPLASCPNQLDQIAAGFLPAGASPMEMLISEASDEAGIPETLAGLAAVAGCVSYCFQAEFQLIRGAAMVFDIELPPSFTPENRDGEVESFELWPIERVMTTLSETQEFKFDSALVAMDLLVRRGVVPSHRSDYLAIVRGLRA